MDTKERKKKIRTSERAGDCQSKAAKLEFLRYASLNVLGMLGLSFYIFADTFFIARGMGAEGLAALNLVLPVYGCIYGIGMMIAIGGGTRYSILKSQKKDKNADEVFTHAVFLALLVSLAFVGVGIWGSGKVTGLLGAAGKVFDTSRIYLQVILFFAPMFMLNSVLTTFAKNDGFPRIAMAAMLTGSISNVILDYLFIFPCKLGMFGAALATGIAPVLGIGIVTIRLLLPKKQSFHLTALHLKKELIGSIAAGGFPTFVAELSSGMVILVLNGIVLRLQGDLGVAAYGIIANLSLIMLSVFNGIAQGAQPVFSRNYGQGKIKQVKGVLSLGCKVAGGIAVLGYLGICLYAKEITAAFNKDGNVQLQKIAEEGLRLYFLAAAFAGTNILLSMYYTATEQVRPAHLISLLRGFILIIPMAFILAEVGGMRGVWLAFPVTEILVTAGGVWWYRRSRQPVKEI